MEIQYPLLSQVVKYIDQISLEHPTLAQWATIANNELNKLHASSNHKLILQSCNSTDMTLLVIPRSRTYKAFQE